MKIDKFVTHEYTLTLTADEASILAAVVGIVSLSNGTESAKGFACEAYDKLHAKLGSDLVEYEANENVPIVVTEAKK